MPPVRPLASPSSDTYTLKGEVVNEQNQAIPEALCTLSGGLLPAEGLAVKTDRKGEFEFPGLQPGRYDIACAAEGYQPISHAGVQVDAQMPALLEIALPQEIVVRQTVNVQEKIPEISPQQTAPPAQLRAVELKALPLTEQKFKAALPTIPGVIRTPNGRINIKGVAEGQSLLLLDSAEAADPVTGSFSIDVPSIAIESLQVNKTTYQAQYGGFAGGLASIHTRVPSDKWRYEIQNPTPNPRIEAGSLVGIADFNPRVFLTGPIVSKRLNFSESLAYDIDKQPVRGQPWPHNEIKTQDLDSLTTFQYIVNPQHLITANALVFPLRRQFANINSLVPQTASSDYGQSGFSVGAMDRRLSNSGLVSTTLFQFTHFESNASGQGSQDMLVNPEGWGGNFFNSYDRISDQEEATQAFQLPARQWHGQHELTLGAEFLRRAYSGTSYSHRIRVLREDGTTAEQIDFSGYGRLAASATMIALFAQDHWTPHEHLAMDAGLRFTGQTLGRPTSFAPRAGIAFSPGTRGRTVLRAGVGIFYENTPLLTGHFTQNPARTVQLFDNQGSPLGTPIVFRNGYLENGTSGSVVSLDAAGPKSGPFNLTWSLEADHEFRPHVVLRLTYLSSQNLHGYILDPVQSGAANAALLLASAGNSRYHEFESTLRLIPREGMQLNISYVHSLGRGDLNSLDEIYVPFEQPVIRPDLYGILPSDVPDRLITWGRIKTHVWRIEAGPLFDVHTGFPYSAVDVLQNYVGRPNSLRLPTFLALDLKLGREFNLPFSLFKSHRFRGYLTILNLTNHLNPRDVFNNVSSPIFGHVAGLQHRSLDTGMEIIY
ncbi:MAG: carboxypeptidase regulatory-like domain-containing protein [Terriglobia bacterium]